MNKCPIGLSLPKGLCPDCDLNNKNHSFVPLECNNDIYVFYSCPGDAIKYNDTAGIIRHFDNVLSYYKCYETYWKWVFDFKGFEFKHSIEITTAIRLARLINNYSNYLLEIKIINTNMFTYSMLQIVKPFLNSDVKNKIVLV
jgi:hypothetical protein